MTDRKLTILGMPLDPEGLTDLAQPLEAVVVIKGLADDGETGYWVTATPDLHDVDCLGMVGYADVTLRSALAVEDE